MKITDYIRAVADRVDVSLDEQNPAETCRLLELLAKVISEKVAEHKQK